MLKVQNVTTYIGRTKIVKRASFDINAGNIVGLIGPNGAGKTTIMKTILGLTKFEGSIQINHQPVTENQHEALNSVGALIEHPAIYPFLSGRQNLALYSHDHQDMARLIADLGMTDYIQQKAKGYSLGMKQKLGIAIALLNHPQLVILDEPMNGLDVEATIGVRKLIKQYADQGTAFLISSHILSELQKVMTHVVLINHGQIIVNQPFEKFEQLHHRDYKLLTENDVLTAQVLKQRAIHYKQEGNTFRVKRDNIFDVQDALYQQQIHLKELAPIETNFEQVVVTILEQQRRADHEA
ncbi:MAG: ATP-binding cassette domain-containing protein [Furfurilactobacillus sp.]|jgi:ABC-2 type transport system ATP-binding protein|uniref:ATP-binding cassette domain-containing protein n=1 Tax=Furfurilactobacillus milii TaxID=2888272 RepID=A0ABT6D905_9LACO|nr:MULTISPECIES: ATP-binding cassette domain-containing protein [Furfurilactobacillus]QLE65773.1 ABC transporter ATP-binding protein [Furfurilactobacillus rossiae]MCF6160315.1 ATP-binding cassette domain-containing protein [Furfurilactobacillus milii]MCF6162258.1 ATP-binding cassette domain-containing protein [Furfurilactobacillus milii]MCF6420129.1 ATP-binding cassette domain-containing protein [Furfurilactobacillus milii]MCH4012297.1 ATP-binding cassette domain-containing protein [Furfurilac